MIVRDGEFTGRKGHGRFIKRGAGGPRPDGLSRWPWTSEAPNGRIIDPRWRPGDRARSPRPRHLGRVVVGAAAADRPRTRSRTCISTIFAPEQRRHDGQLPGHLSRRSRRPASTAPRPSARSAGSVALALRARDRFAEEFGRLRRPTSSSSGSVGPYGAMLADGSEYRGDYDPGEAAFREVHAPRIEALLERRRRHARARDDPDARARRGSGRSARRIRDARPGCRINAAMDPSTSAGEPVARSVRGGRGRPAIAAVGVNCLAPRHVPALLAAARTASGKPGSPTRTAVTPGMLQSVGGRRATARIEPSVIASWKALGAGWLGGCCGTGPGDIAALAAFLEPAATTG